MTNLIIHISGPSGAGKTTLGKKLKNLFGSDIVVKDIDDLRSEFIQIKYGKKFNWEIFDSDLYQKFIDDFIKTKSKPIIFVGLNQYFWHDKKLYYQMHSTHNFYIKINNSDLLRQKCVRFITSELQDIIKNKYVLKDISDNNKKFIKLVQENIERECGIKETLKLNKMWEKQYEKQNYKFLSANKIFNLVKKLINARLN